MEGDIVEVSVGEGFVVFCCAWIMRSAKDYSLVCESDTFDINRRVENLLLEVEFDFLVRSKHMLDIGRSLDHEPLGSPLAVAFLISVANPSGYLRLSKGLRLPSS